MAKVVCAVPNQGWIHKFTVHSLFRLLANDKGHQVEFDFLSEKPVDNARNIQIRGFLKGDADYLLFIDDDNGPLADKDILDLVDLDLKDGDKDIIGMPTPIWNNKATQTGTLPLIWNAFTYVDDLNGWREYIPKDGLQEVDAVGSGAVFIARRVLEKVKPAFVRDWDEDGVVTHGSDLLFCKRAKEAGFKVWCHFDYPCHHVKDRNLVEVHQILQQRDIVFANQPNCNTAGYWDEQWAQREERKLPFYDWIAERVNGGRVLDFGCGRGDLLSLLGPDAVGMDHSEEAIKIVKSRGMKGIVGSLEDIEGFFDVIVSTEVLEHLDDDIGALNKLFEHTNKVIYSVPNNCLPPGLEKEHRRVYTEIRVNEITPHIKSCNLFKEYMVVIAEKEPE